MNEHIRDGLVTDYEELIAGIVLPDVDDRHVLAAAIKCGADVIVTHNMKDFPEETISKYGIETQEPDVFLSYQLDLFPEVFLHAAGSQRRALVSPEVTPTQFVHSLEKLGLAQVASFLRRRLEFI
jgi:hypothetical protein